MGEEELEVEEMREVGESESDRVKLVEKVKVKGSKESKTTIQGNVYEVENGGEVETESNCQENRGSNETKMTESNVTTERSNSEIIKSEK